MRIADLRGKKFFQFNYDRHGERDWLIRVGRGKPRLTREIDCVAPCYTMMQPHAKTGQPKALIVGWGKVKYGRRRTVIT